MESPPKLAGETLIVHHIPLVHCQVLGSRRPCGSSLERASSPFSCPENLGLSRTTSLPERDVVQREALVYSSLIQTSSSGNTFEDELRRGGEKTGGGGRDGSMASDTSSFTSSNSEAPPTPPRGPPTKMCNRPNSLRHNPFLLNMGEDEDYEDDEDEDGDNLNGYLEDSSFHLHGNSNSTLEDGANLASFHLHELDFTPGPFHLHESLEKPWCSASSQRGVPWSRSSTRDGAYEFSARLEGLDLRGLDSQHRHGSNGSTLSMDCGDQEWGEDDDEDEDHSMQGGQGSSECCGSHYRSSQQFSEPFSEPFSDCTLGYASDSSCNSSDGVLVNFSTIYSKTNNGVPAKQPLNLNSPPHQSCTSSVSELIGMGGTEYNSGGGAFYLDLHTSPIEPPQPISVTKESADSSSSCQCPAQPQGGIVELDANCNSYHTHLGSEGLLSSDASATDLSSCLQSQARLVVATQNYYKLVTCDLSSQSSPSPAGSSVTSCSDENSKGSPTQPTEYFLFRHTNEEEEEEEEEHAEDSQSTQLCDRKKEGPTGNAGSAHVIEGQVYVNISPPVSDRAVGGALGAGRLRSRSYERNLDKSPPPRLGSLERMLSCPVRLSEGAAPGPPPPPRVTSFAEMARNKKRPGGSPSQRSTVDASCYHSHSSGEFSPIPEVLHQGQSHSLPPPTRCYSQGTCDTPSSHRHWNGPLRDSPGGAGREARTKAEGGLSTSTDSLPVVVRYSKDQRPTTLPIQPFTFQHQFGKPQTKPLLPLLDEYISQMQARGGTAIECAEKDSEEDHRQHLAASNAPTAVRPSPLGSYSPVRLQEVPSCSGTCSTCSPTPDRALVGPRPPRSISCPVSAGLLPQHSSPDAHSKLGPLPPTPPPAPLIKKQSPLMPALPTRGHCFHRGSLTTLPTLTSSGLSPMGQLEQTLQEEEVKVLPACMTQKQHNVHHLSPQALKWREYRRKNPLGLERSRDACSSSPSASSSSSSNSIPTILTVRRPGPRLVRRNVFDFPPSNHALSFSRLNGQSLRQLQHYSDFLPDYFSQTERPPEEFCLSPDATTEESISIDLQQKRGLVKAINMAVDLIVAHFGTSRDPEVKAKLGNSSVSPNVGHLILKYLCPAVKEVLQDGLRAYVLDIIIGQRQNRPWSVVEASTQLGPSTRVLHSLFSKVSQYSELTNHTMRLNAFIFGLLNLRSLEFWFNHIYTHEDIIAAHYHPWGFLPLSQGACQPMFEELLLLLQPLSLLPFDLDLLFEPHQLQKGQEHLRRKEQLCSARQGLDQSARSTFQLMRSKGTLGVEPVQEALEAKPEGVGPQRDRFVLRREGTWPRMDRAGFKRQGRAEPRSEGAGSESVEEAAGINLDSGRKNETVRMDGRERSADRLKGVGGEGAERERKRERDGDKLKNKQAGWWFQLMQSSQVYIDNSAEGSKFVKWEKRKRGGTEGWRQNHPPPREGVVEGAEANHMTDEHLDPDRTGTTNGNGRGRSRNTGNGTFDQCGPLSEPSRASKGKPSWMGSPPESVLSELKRSKEQQPDGLSPDQGAQSRTGTASGGQGPRWGRLFGAGHTGRTEKADQKPGAKSQKSRMPSGWLSLDLSMLDLVVQSVGAGKRAEPPNQTSNSPEGQQSPPQLGQQQHRTASHTKAAREVRALCHHVATEKGHLSFNKGDVLQVLSRADSDWLLCALGDAQGLVPIIYITLNGQESQGPQQTQ